MKSRELRHRVTIQRPTLAQDTQSGDITQGWEDVVSVWAQISPVSTREFIAAQAAQSKVTTRIKIRYRMGIDASMRVLHLDKVYQIEGVLPDADSGLDYLTLACGEGVRA